MISESKARMLIECAGGGNDRHMGKEVKIKRNKKYWFRELADENSSVIRTQPSFR